MGSVGPNQCLKCQMAINAIKAGKMGNVSNYTPLLGELETKLKTEFRNTIFSTAKQQEMIPGWDYTTKELKLVFVTLYTVLL